MPRKKHKAPPFVMLRRDLLKDPEWRELSSSAKIVYIYLRSKFCQRTLENGDVTLSYGEIDDMFSTATISNAFKELSKNGWIKKTKQGGLFGGICHYRFTGKYSPYFYKGYKV